MTGGLPPFGRRLASSAPFVGEASARRMRLADASATNDGARGAKKGRKLRDVGFRGLGPRRVGAGSPPRRQRSAAERPQPRGRSIAKGRKPRIRGRAAGKRNPSTAPAGHTADRGTALAALGHGTGLVACLRAPAGLRPGGRLTRRPTKFGSKRLGCKTLCGHQRRRRESGRHKGGTGRSRRRGGTRVPLRAARAGRGPCRPGGGVHERGSQRAPRPPAPRRASPAAGRASAWRSREAGPGGNGPGRATAPPRNQRWGVLKSGAREKAGTIHGDAKARAATNCSRGYREGVRGLSGAPGGAAVSRGIDGLTSRPAQGWRTITALDGRGVWGREAPSSGRPESRTEACVGGRARRRAAARVDRK
jgi:hypothetical protein